MYQSNRSWRRKSSRSKRDEPPNSKEDGSLPPEFPNNELVDSFSVSDSCSDSREEVYMQRFWNNSAHGPTDQAGKSRNTYK